MDLSKLSSAPWVTGASGHRGVVVEEDHNIRLVFREVEGRETDCAFVALARTAFDVMMRRGWGVQQSQGKWFVRAEVGIGGCDDPFTALVEADRWYVENGK